MKITFKTNYQLSLTPLCVFFGKIPIRALTKAKATLDTKISQNIGSQSIEEKIEKTINYYRFANLT